MKRNSMFVCAGLLLVQLNLLTVCNWLSFQPPPTSPHEPTSTVTVTTDACLAAVSLSAVTNQIKVGETLVLTINVTNIGMLSLKLTLSTGARASFDYDGGRGKVTTVNDPFFEIVSVSSASIVIKALKVGNTDATVEADGEKGCYHPGYYIGGDIPRSNTVHIEVVAG